MRVAVFGLGYVGTVTAACLAANGHEVWGVDVDPAKVDKVASGRSPVVEPGIEAVMAEAVRAGRLHATTRALEALHCADISLICVGTPSTSQGATELAHVRRAVTDIVEALPAAAPATSGVHSVVVRSTVPPGTVEELVAPLLATASVEGTLLVGAGMCPEFLREGSGVADFFAPPFVVVGTAEPFVAASMRALFEFLEQPVRVVPVRTAEALKYACNAFHATKVSFANEAGRLLRLLGVDSREVLSLFCEDTTLNISPAYLRPGFAFGGSCLPKDLRSLLYLARTNGADLPLLAGTLTSNELVIREIVDRVVATDARTVGMVGLSFKSDTDDLRESPYVELAERLIGKGFDVRIYDPIVNPDRLIGANRRHVEARLPHLLRILVAAPEDAIEPADVVIVSSRDAAVVDALLAARPAKVIDLSGRLGAAVESLPGYEGAGW